MSLSDSATHRAAPDDLGGRSGGGSGDGPVDGPVNELDEDHSSTSIVGPFVVAGVMIVAGLVLLQQTFKIPGDGFDPQGPRFFPLVVVSLWLILAVAYLAQHLVKVLRHGSGLPAERFDHMRGAGALVVLLVVYAFVLDPVGYWISTSVFFVGSARAMGSRNLVRDIVIGVLLALFIYLTFTRGLGVHLPEGVLGF